MPPLELHLYATLAPLLPLDQCAVPGKLEALAAALAARGYAGLEVQVSQLLLIGRARLAAVLRAHGLRWIGKVYSSGGAAAVPSLCGAPAGAAAVAHPPPGASVAAHLAVWEASVRECCSERSGEDGLRAALASISSQSGRDAFHRAGGAEADEFFTRALALEAELGVRVQHETHRHRLLFSPFLAVDCVRRHARLRLLADFSHYSVVCEAPCGEEELEAAVAELAAAAVHIHARVGHEEGPQVLDPRMPRFAGQLAGHGAWWAQVFRAARARGDASVSVTPEFLPPPYCGIGLDGAALTDCEALNEWMAGYVRELFARTMAEGE
jgi:sugar phosphate isomerase/epimerase